MVSTVTKILMNVLYQASVVLEIVLILSVVFTANVPLLFMG